MKRITASVVFILVAALFFVFVALDVQLGVIGGTDWAFLGIASYLISRVTT